MAYSDTSTATATATATRLEIAIEDAWRSERVAAFTCNVPVDDEGEPTDWRYAENVAHHFARIWLYGAHSKRALYPAEAGGDVVEWQYWASPTDRVNLPEGTVYDALREVSWTLTLKDDNGRIMDSELLEPLCLSLTATFS